MFGPLALTVAIALLSSLVLSIFVIPVLCALVLTPGPGKGKRRHAWGQGGLSTASRLGHEEAMRW